MNLTKVGKSIFIFKKRFFFPLLLLLFSCYGQKEEINKTLEAILVSQNGSSRATAYIDSNKIIETENEIFITYLNHKDNEELIVFKTFDKSKDKWLPEKIIDTVYDNHGGGSIVIDSKGYLHLVYGPHLGPFVYRKSSKPFRGDSWGGKTLIGSYMTYPSLTIDSNDKLYLLGRHSIIKGAWSLMFFSKAKNENWSKGKELLRSNYENWPKISEVKGDPKNLAVKNGYTRWNKSIATDNQNNIHVSFKNYEYLPRNKTYEFTNSRNGGSYFVGYLMSSDGGLTWINGVDKIQTPAYPKDIKVVAGNWDYNKVKSNYGISNIALDSNGTPHFLYSKEFKNKSSLFLTYKKEGKWIHKKINLDEDMDYLYCPSSLSFYKDKLYMVATAMNKNHYNGLQLWGEEQENSILKLIQMNSSYKVMKKVTSKDFNVDGPSWLPSLSREDNYAPKLLFTQGVSKSNKTKVYFKKLNNSCF